MNDLPTIYHYDPDTGVALGTSFADPNPMEEGAFLLPAFATRLAPPEVVSGEAARWDGEGWVIVSDHRGRRYWLADGSVHTITDLGEELPEGALDAPPPPPLEDQIASALAMVDAAAEAARLRFITGGAGQSMTYSEKRVEAEAYLAASSPVDADYPFLLASVPMDGENVAAVAATVTQMRQGWKAAGAAIEGMRLRAKSDLRAATDADAIAAILGALNWPTPA